MNEQAVKDFMWCYGMSTAALADALGITTTLLNNKLNPAQRNKLNPAERAAIKAYFLRLYQHSREFLAADLNELPEALRQPE